MFSIARERLTVPSSNIFQGSGHAAAQLESREIIAGRSAIFTPEEQARRLGQAWERLPGKPESQIRFLVVDRNGEIHEFHLDPHGGAMC